jgi:hypothetical protein
MAPATRARLRALATPTGVAVAICLRLGVGPAGANSLGQLGDGTLTNSDTPVEALGIT